MNNRLSRTVCTHKPYLSALPYFQPAAAQLSYRQVLVQGTNLTSSRIYHLHSAEGQTPRFSPTWAPSVGISLHLYEKLCIFKRLFKQ